MKGKEEKGGEGKPKGQMTAEFCPVGETELPSGQAAAWGRTVWRRDPHAAGDSPEKGGTKVKP